MGHSTGRFYGSGTNMNFWYDIIEDSDLTKRIDQLEGYIKNVDHFVDQGAKSNDHSVKTY